MRRLGHPSMGKLQRWIAGHEVGRIERHLATCNYCADRLEAQLDDSDAGIRSALLTLLEVPDELPTRLQTSIDRRMSARADLSLIGEFFGLPLRTVRAMSSTNQGDD